MLSCWRQLAVVKIEKFTKSGCLVISSMAQEQTPDYKKDIARYIDIDDIDEWEWETIREMIKECGFPNKWYYIPRTDNTDRYFYYKFGSIDMREVYMIINRYKVKFHAPHVALSMKKEEFNRKKFMEALTEEIKHANSDYYHYQHIYADTRQEVLDLLKKHMSLDD